MQTLLYPVWFIPVAVGVCYFWFRFGRWLYLHGAATYQRVLRFKEAILTAYERHT